MATSEPWITLKRNFEQGLQLLQDPENTVFIALDGKEFAGFAIVKMTGVLKGYLQTIGVVADKRSKGIGKLLIEKVEDFIFEKYPNVFLCVSSFNLRAAELYYDLGYSKVGELKDFIENGHSELILRKTKGCLNNYNTNKL